MLFITPKLPGTLNNKASLVVQTLGSWLYYKSISVGRYNELTPAAKAAQQQPTQKPLDREKAILYRPSSRNKSIYVETQEEIIREKIVWS